MSVTTTNTDDLPTLAREIVMGLLAEKRIVLNEDQPWKLTARRMMDGKDVSLGELTEVFRALGRPVYLSTEKCVLVLKTGRLAMSDVDMAMRFARLVNGQTVDGMTFSAEALEGFRDCQAPRSEPAEESNPIADMEVERARRRQAIIDQQADRAAKVSR